jgi:hypothetical protein
MQTTANLEARETHDALHESPLPSVIFASLLVALASVPRFWRLREQLFIHSDDAYHILLVRRFAEDNILDWSQARPMYSFLVGLLARMFDGSAFFPAAVSAACGALLVGVVFLWARSWFGLPAAVGAGIIVAVSQLGIYFSKISGPIMPALLVMTIGYVNLSSALAAVDEIGARRSVVQGVGWALIAGLIQGLAATIHRAYLPLPLFTAVFLAASMIPAGRRHTGVLLPPFVLGTFASLALAQVVTEAFQPPSVNHFGYLNQLAASFDQQNNWRTGPGGRGWLFFLTGFAESEGLLMLALAVSGVVIGTRRWRQGDWQCGHLVWLVAATFAYASVVSAGGGITVLRAIAPGMPALAVVGGLAMASWSEALRTRLAESRPELVRWIPAMLGSLVGIVGIALAAPVINARTGYAEAVEVVRANGGFAAAYDGDPWRVLTWPQPIIIVGPKRSDAGPDVHQRDRALVTGTCYLMLHHYEIRDGRLVVPGAAQLDLEQLGPPAVVVSNDRDRLTPARIEDPDFDYEDEVRVYRDPPPCREADSA